MAIVAFADSSSVCKLIEVMDCWKFPFAIKITTIFLCISSVEVYIFLPLNYPSLFLSEY